jgi:hypothetical protein
MAQAVPFDPVMAVCGMIYRDGGIADAACSELAEAWGPIEILSTAFPFTQTSYYQDEMGSPLLRRFLAFSNLIDPSELGRLKLESNALEQVLAHKGKRTINLDPGILSLANLLIATCKNHYHRIPLRDGVYAHLEYVFKNGDFSPLPWTYPDFMTAEYLDFFKNLRLNYKNRLKKTP